MKNRPRSKTRPRGYPYFVLSNPVTASTLEAEKYQHLVATFLAHEEDELFDARLDALLQKSKFRGVFNSEADAIEKFSEKFLFRSGITPKRMAAIYRGMLKLHSHRVSRFFEHQRTFELAFLLAKYDDAEDALEACRADCGESIWYVRGKVTLLAQQGRLDEMTRFADECKTRCTDRFIEFLFSLFVMVATDPMFAAVTKPTR